MINHLKKLEKNGKKQKKQKNKDFILTIYINIIKTLNIKKIKIKTKIKLYIINIKIYDIMLTNILKANQKN